MNKPFSEAEMSKKDLRWVLGYSILGLILTVGGVLAITVGVSILLPNLPSYVQRIDGLIRLVSIIAELLGLYLLVGVGFFQALPYYLGERRKAKRTS